MVRIRGMWKLVTDLINYKESHLKYSVVIVDEPVSCFFSFFEILPIRRTRRDRICDFYRAMHFSAKRGIAIACRLSVCPSVCLSVTLVDCDHIGWNSSNIISPLVSLGCSLFATPTWRVCSKGTTPKFGPKVTHPLLIWASETFDRKLRPNGYR